MDRNAENPSGVLTTKRSLTSMSTATIARVKVVKPDVVTDQKVENLNGVLNTKMRPTLM
jgi:hypothetical protein